MKNDTLDKLIRMAAEAEALETELTGVRRGAPSALRIPPATMSRRFWLAGIPTAVAAGWALWIAVAPRPTAESPIVANSEVQVRRIAGLPPATTPCVVTFDASSQQQMSMMAILRTWSDECECLSWQVHRFQDGSTVARVDEINNQQLDIPVGNAPPVAQLLVVAAANRTEDLPDNAAENKALLDCLNERPYASDDEPDVFALATAVESCLPMGVAVVPKPFVAACRSR